MRLRGLRQSLPDEYDRDGLLRHQDSGREDADEWQPPVQAGPRCPGVGRNRLRGGRVRPQALQPRRRSSHVAACQRDHGAEWLWRRSRDTRYVIRAAVAATRFDGSWRCASVPNADVAADSSQAGGVELVDSVKSPLAPVST